MSATRRPPKPAGAYGSRSLAALAAQGTLAACIATILWLHALLPVPPEGAISPGQRGSFALTSPTFAAASPDSVADGLVPLSVVARTDATADNGILAIVIVLVVLAFTIRAIAVALLTVLVAAVRLTAALLSTSAVFVLVVMLLIATVNTTDALPV